MRNLFKRIGKLAMPVGVLMTMPLVASASTNLRADEQMSSGLKSI